MPEKKDESIIVPNATSEEVAAKWDKIKPGLGQQYLDQVAKQQGASNKDKPTGKTLNAHFTADKYEDLGN